ncbi:glycoside hydrolase family 5 protein [Xylanibacillus composti]|uniref:Endoglucanase n=1 Tax=Xylanibacillus composti TaxID=1572762 RepID=A0A8J4H6R6_9BACL|nr:glycoside hydrolase family 5 protein [Xylanibacillus composti]MDT9726972.1 glycoside hydrolase family 5 protein [Xylanibacillus composti]GIQ69528.1 endoglucanase [Xylanibacillus composti]
MGQHDFKSGVNLGGWISQYRAYSMEHFDTFITEQDVAQIAKWGMDHIRLPVDYPVIMHDGAEGAEGWNEEGLSYIDKCLDWATKYGLGVVLDLHKAPGYSFGTLDKNNLFTDVRMQERFCQIWQMFANRYRSEGEYLQFELLNEVVDQDSTRWNRLAHRAIAAIRGADHGRAIIYGGNYYNSIDELKEIELVPNDDRIIYTFHMYKPILFTHQKAPWVPVLHAYNQTVEYPGEAVGIQEFIDSNPDIRDNHMKEYIPEYMDKSLMEKYLQPAADFIAQTGKPLYCGEYGVINRTPADSRNRWHKDVTDLFKQMNIGSAVWSYKEMSFGLVDASGQVVDEELVRILTSKQ